MPGYGESRGQRSRPGLFLLIPHYSRAHWNKRSFQDFSLEPWQSHLLPQAEGQSPVGTLPRPQSRGPSPRPQNGGYKRVRQALRPTSPCTDKQPEAGRDPRLPSLTLIMSQSLPEERPIPQGLQSVGVDPRRLALPSPAVWPWASRLTALSPGARMCQKGLPHPDFLTG